MNSPVRAFKSVGVDPIFYDRAKGSRVWDVDGNEYVDFVGSWGPMILGHARGRARRGRASSSTKGTSYGAPTELEVEMAEAVGEVVPSIEMVRMVSSGTEATMSAIRLARGYTGREKFIKFDGNYHGHSDALLVAAGCGLRHARHPDTPGVTKGAAADTSCCRTTTSTRSPRRSRRAASRSPRSSSSRSPATWASCRRSPGFLQGLRDAVRRARRRAHLRRGHHRLPRRARRRAGALRRHAGPHHARQDHRRRLPGRRVRRRREIMEKLAPIGPVYQAGTLSGNPVAMVAGLATLRALAEPGVYERLEAAGARVEACLRAAAGAAVARSRSTASARCSRCSSPRGRCGASRTPRRADTPRSPPTGGTCWSAACTSRRRSSRRRSISLALTDDDLERRGRGCGRLVRGSGGLKMRDFDRKKVPSVTVPRLSLYLRKLRELRARGVDRVSSKDLAEMIDLNAAQIRKDFSYFGEFGTRGVGYEVPVLVDEIDALPRAGSHLERRHRRRWSARHGAGSLPRLRRAGLPPRRHVRQLGDGRRRPLRLERGKPRARRARAGRVLPQGEGRHRHGHRAGRRGREHGPAARCSRRQGRSNFAPIKVHAPEGMLVRQVDLSSELMSLSFYLDREQA